jgi:hypothetical protein
MMGIRTAIAAAAIFGLAPAWARAADAGNACDRACLESFVDRYMDALAHHDPSRLPVTAHVRFTENGVAIPLGEALWVTFSKPLPYRHYYTDVTTGQVAADITLMENDYPDFMTLRLKVEQRKIAEIETILTRNAPAALTMPPIDPMWNDVEPIATRLTREQLIAGAVGYVTAVALADGSKAPFSDECSRVEVGRTMALGRRDKATAPVVQQSKAGDQWTDAVAATLGLSCAKQLDTKVYSFITGFDDARFPLVDVEHQVVFGIFVFRRRGNIPGVTYNGRFYEFPFGMRMPDENLAGEAWKFRNGKITRVESTFLGNNVYRAGTGWPGGMKGVSRPIGQ